MSFLAGGFWLATRLQRDKRGNRGSQPVGRHEIRGLGQVLAGCSRGRPKRVTMRHRNNPWPQNGGTAPRHRVERGAHGGMEGGQKGENSLAWSGLWWVTGWSKTQASIKAVQIVYLLESIWSFALFQIWNIELYWIAPSIDAWALHPVINQTAS